jgi:hypothetical protein
MAKLSKVCITCHIKDDVHHGDFGSQCDRCHITANWKKVRR